MKRSIVVALAISALAAFLAVNVALADKLIHVKQASLDTRQGDECVDLGGTPTLWHFIITLKGTNPNPPPPNTDVAAPLSIHVYWDNGDEEDVPLDGVQGSNADYTTTSHAGTALVTDATAMIADNWTGEFNLSHVDCQFQLNSTTVTELHLEDGDDESPIDNGTAVANSSSLHDSATVTGDPDGPVPTGTVTFQFFSGEDCEGELVSSQDVDLDEDGVAHPSQSTGPLGAGSYFFVAIYSGDDTYAGSEADCEPFSVDRVVPDFEKTADTTYTRTCEWTIDKTADPTSIDLFKGDSDTIYYEVTVSAECTDSDFAVSGDITVSNPSLVDDVTVTAVSDDLTGEGVCEDQLPAVLGPGESLVCEYSVSLDAAVDGTNHASATVDGEEISTSADYAFGDPTTVIDGSVDVSDSLEGFLGTVNADDEDKTFNYTRTVTAPEDCGEVPNTASFVTKTTGAEGSDDANVTVNCYELEVSKTANPSLDRTWTWTIEKTGDIDSAHLPPGGTTNVNYTVTLDATSEDSNWAVSGTITIHNPAPIDATINGVSDVLSDDTPVDVDCDVEFPYVLAAGGTLECAYTASLSDASDRTNTATATLQNNTGLTTDFTGEADVDFDAAEINQIDECVDVNDDQYGDLGTFCTTDGEIHFEKEYSQTVGNLAQCTTQEFPNTATFTTNDTGATGSDGHTVTVNTPCLGKTMGFWGNVNGQALLTSLNAYIVNPVVLGGGTRSVTVSSAAKALKILPSQLNACGRGSVVIFNNTSSADCTVASGLNRNTLNTLTAQTLALSYNIKYISGYAGQTVSGLFCDGATYQASLTTLGLSGASTVEQVLALANTLINGSGTGGATTQAKAGAMNLLLGCLNREA